MGDQDFQQTLGDHLLEIKMKDSSRNVLWKKVVEADKVKKTWLGGWKTKSARNNNNTMRKRRRVPRRRGTRRASTMVIERKVRTLKKLIPNGESSVGLDGLFAETAEYISSLQTRVRIMQALVDAFSSTSHQ